MSNSLRSEIIQNLASESTHYDTTNTSDEVIFEELYGKQADQILKLIASKMPEKEIFHPNQVLITEKEWYKAGRNSYRTEFKSILKGETE